VTPPSRILIDDPPRAVVNHQRRAVDDRRTTNGPSTCHQDIESTTTPFQAANQRPISAAGHAPNHPPKRYTRVVRQAAAARRLSYIASADGSIPRGDGSFDHLRGSSGRMVRDVHDGLPDGANAMNDLRAARRASHRAIPVSNRTPWVTWL